MNGFVIRIRITRLFAGRENIAAADRLTRLLAHDAGRNVVMFRRPDRDDASFEADASQILGDLLVLTQRLES